MNSEKTALNERLVNRFGERTGGALFVFVACSLAIGVCGLAGYLLAQPLIFPSLGPTAYLFFESPMSERSSVRNTLVGHFVAIACGFVALALFGLLDDPNVLREGVTFARVGAATFSVALAGAALVMLDASHPPAGATVLIVSLGLLDELSQAVSLAAGVVLVTVAGWTTNHALGVRTPLWKASG
jgi:CBS domain-containing membrane protein